MKFTEIQNYTEYLFNIALKKCGDLQDAEDLTQETMLCALQYPKEIHDMKSWISKVLNNKYYDMLRKKYQLPTVSIDLVPEEIKQFDIQEPDNRPDEVAVRREVAFLADKYRTVIVRHYLNGEKVQKIADDLGIPKGTVLSRLSGGREQMRKGFDKMEQYDKLSYQPEKLEISCHGCQGFHDEPWSLVANDMMKQNILIAAYDKPLTAVEIAHALGIPTAYIENAVYELVKSELMRQIGNKYCTDFMIVSPEQILKRLDTELFFVNEHYDDLLQIVQEYLNTITNANFISLLMGGIDDISALEFYENMGEDWTYETVLYDYDEEVSLKSVVDNYFS